MIRFKDYLTEAQEGVMTPVQARASISPRRWRTMTTHKWFADYMHTPQTAGIAIGFKVDKGEYFDKIKVAHGPMGDDKLRRMLLFTFSRDKLINIDYYQNWHDELIGGHIKWKHIKQLKSVEEENTQGDEGTDKLTQTRKKMTPGEKPITPSMFPGWDQQENIEKDK